jgi:hypothetical protein
MIFDPCSKHNIVCSSYPAFSIADCNLLFVEHFKYLGHIIENSMSDDSDINRELKCLFVRANLLCRRFHTCTLQIKLKLFRAFCICFYDTAFYNYTAGVLSKFIACYNKCAKFLFGYHKYSSVTTMLLELGLPRAALYCTIIVFAFHLA